MTKRPNRILAFFTFLAGTSATPNSVKRTFWSQPLGRDAKDSRGKDWKNSEPDSHAP